MRVLAVLAGIALFRLHPVPIDVSPLAIGAVYLDNDGTGIDVGVRMVFSLISYSILFLMDLLIKIQLFSAGKQGMVIRAVGLHREVHFLIAQRNPRVPCTRVQ